MTANGSVRDWRSAPSAIAITTTAALVAAAAILLARPHLVVFAAPMFGVVAAGRKAPEVGVAVRTPDGPDRYIVRCVESESVELALDIEVQPGDAEVSASVLACPGLSIESSDRDGGRLTVRVSAALPGTFPIRVEAIAMANGGLLRGSVVLHTGDLYVYPVTVGAPMSGATTSARHRLGMHPTRRTGTGTEFGGIRAYADGDDLRSINWRATARRASLQVTERRAESGHDVVIMFDDALQRDGQDAAFHRAVRGAAEIARAALRAGDRVGVVCLDPAPRWLPVRGGRHHFHEIVTCLLDPGYPNCRRGSGTVAPPGAVPHGASVVAFSTLVDTGFALALIELRRRGSAVTAIDLLSAEAPFADDADPLIGSLWALERSAMYRDMATIGVEVIGWQDGIRVTDALTGGRDVRERSAR
ncbi:DUF58 domain-containing protein [Nocardia cyriacigeorgica]|uniref:DUF58 domain-containing protein n=1 Tax=Nocardia cyriacigeorgica TaxID=135487 RepID=UPI002454000E|nr:DUF58 domain-containing protein [Nocardia cyriacigeorgica]